MWKGEKKLNYQNLLEVSKDVQKYNELIYWFNKVDPYFQTNIGQRFHRENTNFQELFGQLDLIKKLISQFNGLPVPENLKVRLAGNYYSQAEWLGLRDQTINVQRSSIGCLQTISPILHQSLLAHIGEENNLYIDRLLEVAKKSEKSLSDLDVSLEQFYSFASIDDMPFDLILKCFDVCILINLFEKNLIQKSSRYKDEFGGYYNGTETDWNNLKEAVTYAELLNRFLHVGDPANKKMPAGNDFSEFIASLNNFGELKKSAQMLKQNLLSQHKELRTRVQRLEEYFLNFDKSFTTNDFSSVPLECLFRWASNLYQRLDEIPAWQEYVATMEDVKKVGLTRIVEEVAANREPVVDKFKAIVRKRYLQLWLDEAYLLYKDIKSLNVGQHERRVEEFVNLDRKLMDLQSKKVLQTWQDNLPALFNTTPRFTSRHISSRI